MRLHLILASAFGFLVAPGVAYAQTEEIQRKVEAKLWIQRVLTKLEGATGAPPLVSIMTSITLIFFLVVSVWLWKAYRKRSGAVSSTR
jgi:hypothetical protein